MKLSNPQSFGFKSLIFMAIFSSSFAFSATMEEQVKGAHAVGSLCKSYAEKLGRDSTNFANLNIQTLRIAESLGYTHEFETYKQQVSSLEKVLDSRLFKEYGSIEGVYDDWCQRFYNAFKKKVQIN